MAKLPSTIFSIDTTKLAEIQGMKNHHAKIDCLAIYIDSINRALDAYIQNRKKGRFDTVAPPTPEELAAGCGEAAKKFIASSLRHAMADAQFWGGVVMPCPLTNNEENELYAYFTAYVRNPTLVGVDDYKGIDTFPPLGRTVKSEEPSA